VAFDQALIDLVDQRIRLATARDRAIGTCVSRDTTGPGADVIFDGSNVAMPVKALASAFLRPGDRCLLERFGPEWIVTGSFTSMGLGDASQATVGPVAGTGPLSSSSYVDVAEVPPFTFDKAFDNTLVRLALVGTCYLQTTAGAGMNFGMRLTSLTDNGFTATDYTVASLFFDNINTHMTVAGMARTSAPPAGRYSVQLRWRRVSGSGTFKMDGNDRVVMEVDEDVRMTAPVL
jgi:hypothetical protein